MFFHRMLMDPRGCRNIWFDMWIIYLLMGLLNLQATADEQTYWAYVPDPPILHPAMWDGPEVPVYVNDTSTLGLPSNGHMQQQIEKNFNYSGVGVGLPICLAKNTSVPGCLQNSPITMHTNDSSLGWTVRFISLGDWSVGKKIKIPVPQMHLPCKKEAGLGTETVPWKDCRRNSPIRYDVNGTGRYIIDWSRSSHTGWAPELASGLWSSDTQHQQNSLWGLGGQWEKSYEC